MHPCLHAPCLHAPCFHAPLPPYPLPPFTLASTHLCLHASLPPCTPAPMHPCLHAPPPPCTPASMHPCPHAPLPPCTPVSMLYFTQLKGGEEGKEETEKEESGGEGMGRESRVQPNEAEHPRKGPGVGSASLEPSNQTNLSPCPHQKSGGCSPDALLVLPANTQPFPVSELLSLLLWEKCQQKQLRKEGILWAHISRHNHGGETRNQGTKAAGHTHPQSGSRERQMLVPCLLSPLCSPGAQDGEWCHSL